MSRSSPDVGLALLGVIGCNPVAPAVVAPRETVTIASAEPVTHMPLARVDPIAPASVCSNDSVNTSPNCESVANVLGECSAMAYYACPAESNVPQGKRFRAATAARIATCYLQAAPTKNSCQSFESCVRQGVSGACAQSEDLAWCKAHLPACKPEKQELCAKLLSSLEPALREQAIDNLKELNPGKLASSCKLVWDLAGYPFCPFCNFDAD